MLAGSPVLPLPVEFVAGGEGRPEPFELVLATGLGGSGKSGRFGGEDMYRGSLPKYTAESGRFPVELIGRGDI